MDRKMGVWIVITVILLAVVSGYYEWRLSHYKSENKYLAQRLHFLEPPAPKVISPSQPERMPYSAYQVMEKGAAVDYRTLELNNAWVRPLYIPLWHSKAWNCGRFCYIPRLIENNRHRVFIYQGGGSYWFDLSPTMGFTDDTSPMGIAFKTGDEVAIIALEARIKQIKKLENQLQIMIEPRLKGYHIVALPYPEFEGTKCQVVTPEGYQLEVPLNAYSKGSCQ